MNYIVAMASNLVASYNVTSWLMDFEFKQTFKQETRRTRTSVSSPPGPFDVSKDLCVPRVIQISARSGADERC